MVGVVFIYKKNFECLDWMTTVVNGINAVGVQQAIGIVGLIRFALLSEHYHIENIFKSLNLHSGEVLELYCNWNFIAEKK